MTPHIDRVFRDNNGIAALEYALIAGLMFAIIVSAVNLLIPLTSVFTNLGVSLTTHAVGT
jgi:Flp pilus assembly pilin Flp